MGRFALVWVSLAASLPAADLGKQLLDAAAQGRNVESLIAQGAPLNAKDKNGRTALMLAAQHGHAAAVEVLLAKGADPAIRDRGGATAWVLAVFDRADNDAVVKLLPSPPRPKIAVEALWSRNNLYNSCVLRVDQLTGSIGGLELDRLALIAFSRAAAGPGRALVEITGGNTRGLAVMEESAFAGNDAVVVLNVHPGVACVAQDSADRLRLMLEVQLVRSKDRAVLLKKTFGGGALKSLESPMVTSPAQYLPVYQEWLKPYAGQAYTAVVEAWFRSE